MKMKHKMTKIRSSKKVKSCSIIPSPTFQLKYKNFNLSAKLTKLGESRKACHNKFEVTDSDILNSGRENNANIPVFENTEINTSGSNIFNKSDKLLDLPNKPRPINKKKRRSLKSKCLKFNVQHDRSGISVKPSVVKMRKDDEVLQDYSAEKKSDLRVSTLNCLIHGGDFFPSLVENHSYQQRTCSSDTLKNHLNNKNELLRSTPTETDEVIELVGSTETDENSSNKKYNKLFDKTHLTECCITVNCVDMKETTTAKVYELRSSRFLIVTKPGNYFYLIGILELQLIKGSVEVLGYRLNKPKEKILIYSLYGSSHLFIKTNSDNNNVNDNKAVTTEMLISLGLTEKRSKKILREAQTSALFIVSRKNALKSSTVWPMFFENHLSFCVFPQKDLLNLETRPCHRIESKTGCLFEANLRALGLKAFKEMPEWSEIEMSLDLSSQDFPKVVLCGGKSVGKSTLLRYIVNKCLWKWNRALVIDLDPGQCEFTVAGCVSVTMIEEPLLGPNYSHLKEPLRSVFLGEIDVTKCPENYIEGCKLLINYAKKEHGNIPWLINTMGFTRGIGVSLNCGIIKTVIPTHVVQIESKDRKLNFPERLDPGFVYCQNVGAFSTGNEPLNYQLYIISSGSEYQGNSLVTSRGLSPPEARNLVMLSYLSNMLSSEVTNLSQVTPYVIDMERVELRTTDKYTLTKPEVAATMNGNMVALCCLVEDSHFPNCQGFGIVRGIDWQAGILYLITPVHRSTLRNINCLVKGNVALPESLYYNQGMVVGQIPYLAFTSGRPTTRFAKRDFRSLPVNQREEGRSEVKPQ